jgi:PAS domain S-box-containing protein
MVDRANIRFERFYSVEGPSKSNVGPFVQDDQGFMWFGTPHGLNRFDGYTFKVFTHDPKNARSISGPFIHALFKDHTGTLWVGCNEFLNKFDSATETFTRYPVRSVFDISQDATGTLWLSTPTGLYALNPTNGSIRHYSHDPSDPTSLESNEIKSTGENKEGTFWVATSEGLDSFDRSTGKVTFHIPTYEASHPFSFYEDRFGVFWIYHVSGSPLAVFDRKTKTLTRISFQDETSHDLAVSGVTGMLEDQSGSLWLATNGAGLLQFDREHQRFFRYRNRLGDPESLAQNSVRSVFRDREGIIWASLGGFGITRFTSRALPFKRYRHDFGNPADRGEPFVGAIYEDRQGILWIGTHEALHRIDRSRERYVDFQLTGAGEGTDAITICQDRLGYLWIGTYGHGLFRFDPQTLHFKRYRHNPADPHSLSNDIVPRVFVDHNGTLWAATHDGLNRYDAGTDRFTAYKIDLHGVHPYYLDLAEDGQGILWLGTESSGLQRFDPATGHFTTYQHEIAKLGSLSDNRVNSVHFDHSGTMWVATQEGLNRFEAATGKFTTYSQRQGLPSDDVGCILEDRHGDLWMSTDDGVARFSPQTGAVKSYSTADGLPGPDLTGWGTCFRSAKDEMFFGGFSGATAFFPDDVIDSKYTPPVALTDFMLLGTEVGPGAGSPLTTAINYANTVVLSHTENIFSIGFSALSYLNPLTNRYRYKLEGLDRDWTEVGSDRRFATYTTLPPGKYTFRVEGATSRGPWNEAGAILHVEILPAWWNTWWFRVVSAGVFVSALWGLYRWRIQQVRHQEKQLRDVIDAAPAMVWSALPDGSNVSMNNRWTEYTGSSAAGLGWQTAVRPDDLKRHLDAFRASSDACQPFEDEVQFRRSDGEYRWFSVQATPMRSEQGKIIKWYGIVTDIEDRKRAESLLAGEKRIVEMVAKGDSLPKILDTICRLVEAEGSGALASIFLLNVNRLCYGSAPSIPKAYAEAIDGSVIGPSENPCGRAAYLGEQVIVEDISGDPFWASFRDLASPHGLRACWSTPVVSSQGKVIATLAIYYRERRKPSPRDQQTIEQIVHLARFAIERKLIQEALTRSESYLAQAQRIAHIGSWAWQIPSRNGLYISEEWYRIYGFDPKEGMPTWEQRLQRVHPGDRALWQATIDRAIGEKLGYDVEFRILPPHSTVKYIHSVGQPVLDSSGELLEFVGVAMDVTERKHAEESLRSSEAYLVEAQSLTHTGSCAIDGTSHETVYWSDEMFRLFGFDPQQGLPMFDQWLQRIHPDDREKLKLANERTFLNKVSCDVEFRIVKPDGTVKHIHGIGHPVLSPTGELVQVVGTMVDITERKRAEESRERLRQLEADLAHLNRVSTMGELTASLAHEIKQPIGAAVTNAEACVRLLDRDQPDIAEAREAAVEMVRDARRAADIIDRFRVLYQKGSPQLDIVDVNEVISDMVIVLQNEANRRSVTMHTNLAEGLPKVMADRVQLQQAFMNLMLNGIEAMPDTGGELSIKSQLADDGQLLISVTDTGVGLPPENIDKIFDAFFTTKSQGTGLGLAITRSIVESHGGRIWATPNSGGGTTFHFTLPSRLAVAA